MKDLYRILFGREKDEDADSKKLMRNINDALEDIHRARINFDMAVGDDNIELAIYELSTAEIKYRNLIREARRLGIVSRSFSSLKSTGDDSGEVEEDKCS